MLHLSNLIEMDATYLERSQYEYAISIDKIVQKYKVIDN